MICNKKIMLRYVACIIITIQNISPSSIEQSMEKNKTKILQIVQENEQLATECESIVNAIIQETEEANQFRPSLLVFNQASIALDLFSKEIHSLKIDEIDELELLKTFQHYSNSFNEIEKAFESIKNFTENDINTYKKTIDSIKNNIKKLEENTPLKKSKYLQFFNATKQLESAIELFKKTIAIDDDWLVSQTESVLKKNSNLKHEYSTHIDDVKNSIEILESYKKPNQLTSEKIDVCKETLRKLKQKTDVMLEKKQHVITLNPKTVVKAEVEINQLKQIADSIEDQIIKEIYSKKTVNVQNHMNQESSYHLPLDKKELLNKRKNNIEKKSKKKTAIEKKQQKKEQKLKKIKEHEEQKKLKSKHVEPAINKTKKQSSWLNKNTSDIEGIKPTEQKASSPLEAQKKESESFSAITQSNKTEAESIENQFLAEQSCSEASIFPQEEQSDNNLMLAIEKKRNEALYKLQDLQYYEEKNNVLAASLHDQEIQTQEQVNNLKKQIDQSKKILSFTPVNQEMHDYLTELYNKQKHHILNIEQINEEVEQHLIELQSLKEQNIVTQEELLKTILKLYNIALESIKIVEQSEQKSVMQELENKHIKSTSFYTQTLADQKKAKHDTSNEILQKQKMLEEELQLLKKLELLIEKRIYTTKCSQEELDTLMPAQIQQAKSLEQLIRSQQKTEQKINFLLNL